MGFHGSHQTSFGGLVPASLHPSVKPIAMHVWSSFWMAAGARAFFHTDAIVVSAR